MSLSESCKNEALPSQRPADLWLRLTLLAGIVHASAGLRRIELLGVTLVLIVNRLQLLERG